MLQLILVTPDGTIQIGPDEENRPNSDGKLLLYTGVLACVLFIHTYVHILWRGGSTSSIHPTRCVEAGCRRPHSAYKRPSISGAACTRSCRRDYPAFSTDAPTRQQRMRIAWKPNYPMREWWQCSLKGPCIPRSLLDLQLRTCKIL